MSVKSLVNDPEFGKLSADEKQSLLATIDPDFKNISLDEMNQVVSGLRSPTTQVNRVQNAMTPVQEFSNDLSNSNGKIGTINTLLKAPEKMSRQGLQMISSSIPESVGGPMTGNRALDVLKGTPRVLAESVGEVAPGFVSKGAILTSGALQAAKAAAPMAKLVMKGIGSQAESLSGAMPGSAEAAYKAPFLKPLQFQPGKKAASALYEAGKEIGGDISPELENIPRKIAFVKKASNMATFGELNQTEALAARKELDAIKNQVTDTFYRSTRAKFDSLAKDVFSEADAAHKQGLMADSLRQIIPQNMHGGASGFKVALGTAMNNMGKVGKVMKFALSPAAVGAAATVAGDVGKVVSPIISNPEVGALLPPVLKEATSQQLKDFIKSVKKENPDISDEEAKTRVRKIAKQAGLSIPKRKK